MNLVVFPGQGSQKPNMVKDLFDNFVIVQKLFREAEEISMLPLTEKIFNGTSEDLKSTRISQVALMLASISILRVLEEVTEQQISDMASLVAGHSLGEYTALVAAGALSFADAVALLTARGEAMENAYPLGGGMLAVIGVTDISLITEIVNKANAHGGVCEIANDNTVGQVILSGNIQTLEKAAQICKEEYKVKLTKFLEVSGPFHSSLMVPAVPILETALNQANFNLLQVPFISNVTASKVEDVAEIKQLLLKQLTSPVRWRESMLYAIEQGVDTIIEVGPNKVLTGLAKRIDNNLKCVSIEGINDINNYMSNFMIT